MKKLALLPLIGILSACTGTGGFLESKTNKVAIEERGGEEGSVSTVVRDESTFTWSDSATQQDSNTAQTNAKAKAVSELKASDTNFVLYFSYDGTDIGDKATQEIIKHANFMRDNPSVKLRLEGHADERGTREYNLALGENRALAVKEVLSLYDGMNGRIEVISFGEEKPIAKTHDESSWEKNRRVEFIYE